MASNSQTNVMLIHIKQKTKILQRHNASLSFSELAVLIPLTSYGWILHLLIKPFLQLLYEYGTECDNEINIKLIILHIYTKVQH